MNKMRRHNRSEQKAPSLPLWIDIEKAVKFAKANRNRTDELGNLARSFLMLESDGRLIETCLDKAHKWLERAMP